MSDLRTLSPTTSLPWMLGALRAALGLLVERLLLDGAQALLLHRRLGVISGRLERMLVRFAAGRKMVLAASARTVGVREAVADTVARMLPVRIWPAGFGWALLAGYQVAGFGGHLRLILEHPDMVGLLRASPQARRLLSPVCRMLGIEAATLRPRLAGEVEAVVVKPVRAKAVRRKAVVPDLPPLVWPRGVLAMVRKYKRLGKW